MQKIFGLREKNTISPSYHNEIAIIKSIWHFEITRNVRQNFYLLIYVKLKQFFNKKNAVKEVNLYFRHCWKTNYIKNCYLDLKLN